MDVVTVRAVEGAAFGEFLHVTAREDITRPQFHLAVRGRVGRRAEAVVLEIAVAVFVL